MKPPQKSCTKLKTKKKWRSILLFVVVGFNRTLILDKSYRKSKELYFRVADSRLAINKRKSITYFGSKIRFEGRWIAAGFVAGAADCCWPVWEKSLGTRDTRRKERNYTDANLI